MFRTVLKSSAPSTLRSPSLSLFFASLCALLLVLLTSSLPAYAQSQPGGNVSDPGIRAVDIARPAVVRIYTSLPSRLTVHFNSSDVTFPQDTTKSYTPSLSGSGTFISSNGDILTADHVVNPPKDASLDASPHKLAASDISNYVNQNAKTLGLSQMTPAQVEQTLNSAQLRSSSSYDSAQSEVYLSTDYTGPLTATTMDQVPSTIHATVDKIEAQSAVNAQDIAIIHAPFTDTPSVSLGDSSTVQTQNALKIIGFPGNGDINDIPSNLLTPSINDINVSSIKTTTSGSPVIQVSGTVGPGESGGPALDTNGNVVGIVSFGTVTANGATTGTSFLQGSNSANDLLKTLNLITTSGTFQTLWSQAFASYASTTSGHWHTSQQLFQQLVTQYPNFKAVQTYLDYTSTQAQTEVLSQPTPTPTASSTANTTTSTPTTTSSNNLQAIAMTVGAVAVLIILVLFFVVMNIRGRRKSRAKSGASDLQKPSSPAIPLTQGQPSSVSAVAQKPPTPAQTPPPSSSPLNTAVLRPWPCGHMNRSTARFCSICGEPAPSPTTSIYPVKP